MGAGNDCFFASSQLRARVGAKWSSSVVSKLTWLPRVLHYAIANEACGISCIVVSRVAEVDIATAEKIHIFLLDITLRDVCGQLPVKVFNAGNIL